VSRARLPAWLFSVLCVVGAGAVGGAAHADATQQELIAKGKAAFTHRCAMCHREGQTGTFILARRLGKEKSLLEQRTDLQPAYIRQVVRSGLVNMPRLSRVEMPDPDLDGVIAYLTVPRSSPAVVP
jgi:mono/diheme cytochrome c family protein